MWISSLLLLKLSRDFINLTLISAKAPSKWYFKFAEPQNTQKKRSFYMFDYSKLSYQLKRETKNFTDKIAKNISRPKYKLVFQMMYGLLE